MNTAPPKLPTPHLDKLTALLRNPRLPPADKPRVEEALSRYHDWIREIEAVTPGQKSSVQKLVEVTNRYKTFVELDLIFDSPENFLYRQICYRTHFCNPCIGVMMRLVSGIGV